MGVDLTTLALVALAAVLIAGALSPLETLGWWAGWFGERADDLEPELGDVADEDASEDETLTATPNDDSVAADPIAASAVDPWLVFLSGIHAVGPVTHARREARLVASLRRALPRGRVLEVFPYSVTNRALTGERVFARVWRWALRGKLGSRRLGQVAGFLINARNFWQVLVSVDRRYGPYYNRGSAALVLRALRKRGYEGGGGRIVLVGYSGGAQVALGTAPFLKEATGAEVTVVMLGGVMAADPGVLEVDRAVHVYGTQDRIQRWSAWFFPGRWSQVTWSPWNQARARGTLEVVELGPCDHTGVDGYLDEEAHVADGRSHLELTVDVLAALASGRRSGLPTAA
jgi:pimeloyl-ACP methyl ester carboxylesterase